MATLTASAEARTAAEQRGLPAAPNQAARRRQADLERIAPVLAILRELWPAAFCLPPKPLVIGVHNQIKEALGEVPELGVTLRYWTTRLTYVKAVSCGADRINLDGSVAGPMAAEFRDSAVLRLRGGRR
jgi:sRNA-binding protein